MAFGALLGSLIVPAVAGAFKSSTATTTALDASETMYQNANNLDQITELNQRRITERKNLAFNAKVTEDSEDAKEADTLQNLMVSVSGADKSVTEKLIQTVSS